jgi:hypothetical protein
VSAAAGMGTTKSMSEERVPMMMMTQACFESFR